MGLNGEDQLKDHTFEMMLGYAAAEDAGFVEHAAQAWEKMQDTLLDASGDLAQATRPLWSGDWKGKAAHRFAAYQAKAVTSMGLWRGTAYSHDADGYGDTGFPGWQMGFQLRTLIPTISYVKTQMKALKSELDERQASVQHPVIAYAGGGHTGLGRGADSRITSYHVTMDGTTQTVGVNEGNVPAPQAGQGTPPSHSAQLTEAVAALAAHRLQLIRQDVTERARRYVGQLIDTYESVNRAVEQLGFWWDGPTDAKDAGLKIAATRPLTQVSGRQVGVRSGAPKTASLINQAALAGAGGAGQPGTYNLTKTSDLLNMPGGALPGAGQQLPPGAVVPPQGTSGGGPAAPPLPSLINVPPSAQGRGTTPGEVPLPSLSQPPGIGSSPTPGVRLPSLISGRPGTVLTSRAGLTTSAALGGAGGVQAPPSSGVTGGIANAGNAALGQAGEPPPPMPPMSRAGIPPGGAGTAGRLGRGATGSAADESSSVPPQLPGRRDSKRTAESARQSGQPPATTTTAGTTGVERPQVAGRTGSTPVAAVRLPELPGDPVDLRDVATQLPDVQLRPPMPTPPVAAEAAGPSVVQAAAQPGSRTTDDGSFSGMVENKRAVDLAGRERRRKAADAKRRGAGEAGGPISGRKPRAARHAPADSAARRARAAKRVEAARPGEEVWLDATRVDIKHTAPVVDTPTAPERGEPAPALGRPAV